MNDYTSFIVVYYWRNSFFTFGIESRILGTIFSSRCDKNQKISFLGRHRKGLGTKYPAVRIGGILLIGHLCYLVVDPVSVVFAFEMVFEAVQGLLHLLVKSVIVKNA